VNVAHGKFAFLLLQSKGDDHPFWLTFDSKGSSVKFPVPHQVKECKLKTNMCAVNSSIPDNIASDGLKNVVLINYTKATALLLKKEALDSFEDEELQSLVSSIESGNSVQVAVVFENNVIVKNTTIYLVYDGPINEETGFIMVCSRS
jgi:hypothetical protein